MDDNDPDEPVVSTCQPLPAVRQVALECRVLEVASSDLTTTTTAPTLLHHNPH